MDLREELLDRAFQASDSFDRYVLEHAQIVGDPETMQLAREISDKLGLLYQMAGGLTDDPLNEIRARLEKYTLSLLLDDWHKFPNKTMSAKQIVEHFFSKGEAFECETATALRSLTCTSVGQDEKPTAKAVGRVLRKLSGRVYGSKRLICEQTPCGGPVNYWRVESEGGLLHEAFVPHPQAAAETLELMSGNDQLSQTLENVLAGGKVEVEFNG